MSRARGLDAPTARASEPFVYRGRSMAGTFRPGDWLYLEDVPFREVRVGDVVVVRSEGSERALVHRVRRIEPRGLVLRGDANESEDPGVATAAALVGRVYRLQRGRASRGVLGGWRGRITSARRHAWRRLGRAVLEILRPILAPAYRRLRERGTLLGIWKPRLQTLHLRVAGERCVSFRYRGREVARLYPDVGHFRCAKPFDLVLKPLYAQGRLLEDEVVPADTRADAGSASSGT